MKIYKLTYHDGVEVVTKEIEADSFLVEPNEVIFYRERIGGNQEAIFSIDRSRYISCERKLHRDN